MSRKVTIPIYDGDDFERLAELRRAVDIAERKLDAEESRVDMATSPLRLGDEGEAVDPAFAAAVKAAQDAYDDFVDEAAERAEEWELRPIGHEEFRELMRQHPPRKVDGEDNKQVDHPDDEHLGVNTETFGKALLLFIDPEDDEVRTVVKPEFVSEAALRKRVKRLSAGEFDSMWVSAFFLNNGAVTDPKLSRFSPAGPRSSET